MRVCLFEDSGCAQLEPLALTRPAFDLLCGQSSLSAKQCRYFAPCLMGVLVRPYLADLYRLYHPRTPTNDLGWLRSAPTVLVNGRWLPPPGTTSECGGPCLGMVEDEVAYAVLSPDQLVYCSPQTIDDCLEVWKNTLPMRPAGGAMIRFPWDLVDHNIEQICRDVADHGGTAAFQPPSKPVAVVGPADHFALDPTAQLDPLVVIDTRNGPVIIDAQATVNAFSRLEGPCYIGPHAQVLGAKIRGGTTIGPQCRVGGEVENCIMHGYSNKYHDGFLGHSYIGEWVNLGAGTQNSDLRNDYGNVNVTIAGERISTGLNKVGCFVGDHTKMGLVTLLNTGSNIGVGCNLLPSGTLLPKYIPSFASWWNGSIADQVELPNLYETARTVMQRRDQAFTERHANVLQYLFRETAAERRRVIRENEMRMLRRSA